MTFKAIVLPQTILKCQKLSFSLYAFLWSFWTSRCLRIFSENSALEILWTEHYCKWEKHINIFFTEIFLLKKDIIPSKLWIISVKKEEPNWWQQQAPLAASTYIEVRCETLSSGMMSTDSWKAPWMLCLEGQPWVKMRTELRLCWQRTWPQVSLGRKDWWLKETVFRWVILKLGRLPNSSFAMSSKYSFDL